MMKVDDSPGTVKVDHSPETGKVDDSPGTVMVDDDSPGTGIVDYDSLFTMKVDDDSSGPVFVDDFPEWASVLEKVCLLYEDGNISENLLPCIRRGENEEPKLTTEQEYESFLKEVKDSMGFDISFNKYRCVFNYKPLNFDDNDFAIFPETTKQLIDKLSEGSLAGFNKEKGTSYRFDKVVKANYHRACGVMYFITFEAKQPSDDEPKVFRAKVRYLYHITTQYISCELKPEEKDAEEKDSKKPRLTEEAEPKYIGGW